MVSYKALNTILKSFVKTSLRGFNRTFMELKSPT